MKHRRALFGLIAFGLLACGDEPLTPDAAPSTVTLTLGTVDGDGAGFFPMSGDQPLVPGSQGGFHVWLKFRIEGLPSGTVRVKRTARRARDDRLILLTESVQDIDTSSGSWELPSPLPSFMCPTPIGVQVRDELVRFIVVLENVHSGEVLGQGTAEATPRCPEGGQREFCERICSG